MAIERTRQPMWVKVILLILAGGVAPGCSYTPSMLNANPVRYNGKFVVLRGFVDLPPEAHALRAWENGWCTAYYNAGGAKDIVQSAVCPP